MRSEEQEFVSEPVKPTEGMLRPFYDCPPDELELAWSAMLAVAKNQQARASLSTPPDIPKGAVGVAIARAVKYLGVLRQVRAVVDEWPEVEMAGSPLSRIRTLVAFVGSAAPVSPEPADEPPKRMTMEEFERDDHGYSGDCA